ncbi:MAG: type II toxin-antitoxin system RelE/ParE family toxin [Agriterribacter sp.]
MIKRKITWTKRATNQLKNAIQYIRKDSPRNAESVKERILAKVNELADGKIVHSKDPLKINNDGNYLYFEILKYRVVYFTTEQEVFIVRVRHTKMEPKAY